MFERGRQIVHLSETVPNKQNRNARRGGELCGEKVEKCETGFPNAQHVDRLAAQPVPVFYFLLSPHSGVALPFDFGHLSGNNIDIERSVAADAFLPILFCDGVMTGRD